MTAYEIIKKKRDNLELSYKEIFEFVNGYLRNDVSDYQVSAFLMAVFFNGMSDDETEALTKVMANSGEMLKLDSCFNNTVDKHSTGGVGDKTTLIVAPIVASLGCVVAKMSGRGLGFTGGTVDKLSSIPGYKVGLNIDEFLDIVKETNVSVVSQSEALTPADKKIYALRDVTATVDSVPLIASSIMSKKIATGSKSIVLDVKFGSGAFMKDKKRAEILAEKMLTIGKRFNRNMAAVLTNMDKPLGFAIGNNLEVIEAINLLKGEIIPDLYEECVTLASVMLNLSKQIPLDKAEELVVNSIKSGAAFEKFREWIVAQGGDISYIDNVEKFEKAKYTAEILSEKTGYISEMDTEQIGICAGLLGAGRENYNDTVDYSAGIILDKKTGDFVNRKERLCRIFTNDKSVIQDIKDRYIKAISFSDKRPEINNPIYKIIF